MLQPVNRLLGIVAILGIAIPSICIACPTIPRELRLNPSVPFFPVGDILASSSGKDAYYLLPDGTHISYHEKAGWLVTSEDAKTGEKGFYGRASGTVDGMKIIGLNFDAPLTSKTGARIGTIKVDGSQLVITNNSGEKFILSRHFSKAKKKKQNGARVYGSGKSKVVTLQKDFTADDITAALLGGSAPNAFENPPPEAITKFKPKGEFKAFTQIQSFRKGAVDPFNTSYHVQKSAMKYRGLTPKPTEQQRIVAFSQSKGYQFTTSCSGGSKTALKSQDSGSPTVTQTSTGRRHYDGGSR